MAGHSQFANIKHRKGVQDVKRAKRFTKLTREIIVAARKGLPDPEFNPMLRSAISAAKKENLPKDRIEAAIKSASGNAVDDNYEEVTYEGYGPGGIAIIVHAVTNNRNRTAAELRHIFLKCNGKLGESGSVSFLFDHVGIIAYKSESINNFNDFFNIALELNANDIEEHIVNDNQEKLYYVICNVNDFGNIRDNLSKKFFDAEIAKLSWRPKELIKIQNLDLQIKIKNLIHTLEDNDDVQYVKGNFAF
ncbi:YebC/PmpR family DNA-binding transcriptional regulator [Neoehrlichia mikurensis]|uniref:Probable transcriptional regulatory protein LUA81_03980 n=1 Tax=Neoehrlichia mikurensis TaxID=89586 RepID=A0A9Q9BWT3_9RICK|nr:YebC/PmpR family DNA-binding transcriptional regulator [Neoehrlichia mikurensis]QXK92013.1 YebC/PmpR family DNA-binding transcriptional regulator [Neoehrlichia mikurensis]QXK92471.1 YebC/PmpR family DNA-binding transcriptional regulator [Neoehrlichia mikurensis]QXK93706.1 YebC/PmpR family DNA-binding transcriptional regulator [Neoehrlichia mikurensis]UTO55321.1 YebC/PmpR family DNA-binding transcriptional regulator [Neoehrlichia mikurensis]UTO56241.1 YebC/PmpR family DNA-binding transcripti